MMSRALLSIGMPPAACPAAAMMADDAALAAAPPAAAAARRDSIFAFSECTSESAVIFTAISLSLVFDISSSFKS